MAKSTHVSPCVLYHDLPGRLKRVNKGPSFNKHRLPDILVSMIKISLKDG